jgi:putative endonuclease
VTSDLIKRVYQHRTGTVDGFTKRYGIHLLVWYEIHATMESAILREKQLKNWSRKAKKHLIEQHNPNWKDLWTDLVLPSLASGLRQSLPQ